MTEVNSEFPDWMVEQAVPEDAEKIAVMHSKSFLKTYLKEGREEDNQQVINEATRFISQEGIQKRVELLNEALMNFDQQFYQIAMRDDNQPIGLIYGTKGPKTVNGVEEYVQEIHALYVDEAYHGANVGKALVDEFVQWADADKPIELGVDKENERAKRFYTKMGFEALNDDRDSYYPFIQETTMKRRGEAQ